jgi:hypothetical protein
MFEHLAMNEYSTRNIEVYIYRPYRRISTPPTLHPIPCQMSPMSARSPRRGAQPILHTQQISIVQQQHLTLIRGVISKRYDPCITGSGFACLGRAGV